MSDVLDPQHTSRIGLCLGVFALVSCLFTSSVWAQSESGGLIVNPASGKCLDVSGGSTDSGARVTLWDCNGSASQLWVRTDSDTIVNVASGKCLDLFGGAFENGTAVGLWDCHGGTDQRWRNNGSLISYHSGNCVDILRGETNNGAEIASWRCNGAYNQNWEVQKADGKRTSTWDCYRPDQESIAGAVTIDWGHTLGAAEWACNAWLGQCDGKCRTADCSPGVWARIDSCSAGFLSPLANAMFRSDCNEHDICFSSPWSLFGVNAFDACNARLEAAIPGDPTADAIESLILSAATRGGYDGGQVWANAHCRVSGH